MFRSTRARVKDNERSEAAVSDELSLRLADGESSITLSLSPSTLPGEARIGDNLLVVKREP